MPVIELKGPQPNIERDTLVNGLVDQGSTVEQAEEIYNAIALGEGLLLEDQAKSLKPMIQIFKRAGAVFA